MIDSGIEPHRATILVGYGAFGRDVLRRLLASTAPRGVLRWEEARGGAAPTERYLQDLSLLWIGDDTNPDDHRDDDEGSALEMMRDLYRQIEHVEGTPADVRFATALTRSAEKLLSASTRSARTGLLPLGLDVIVLAQPKSREAVGMLDRLLTRGMERLANNANLDRAVQGSEALNFIAVLDFENYWDRSAPARDLRRAVYDSVERWQKRRVTGHPAFGRVYFVDGRTDEGFRESYHRIDEISLFLEFLLFEGQRGGALQRLYQPPGRHESSVATFGIRLVERSAGLLSHLAAARFASGFLEYLAGTAAVRLRNEPTALSRQMEAYGPDALEELLDAPAIHAEVEATMSSLEHELSVVLDHADWPHRVRERYTAAAAQLESRLSARARSRMIEISGTHLAPLPDLLRSAIIADLHDQNDPVPLGSVITEIEQSLRRLQSAPAVPEGDESSARNAETMLTRLESLRSDYDGFLRERIQVEGLRRWWPMIALALSAAFTPVVTELIGEIPPPDPMRFLLERMYAALQAINHPFVIGALLFIASWAAGLAAHRGIAARVERADRFYSDQDRGRFIDRLRSGLKPGGMLRIPLDLAAARLLRDMAMSVRGEVASELGRILERLRERQREILWLHDQMRGFLRMHGLIGGDSSREPELSARNGTGIRHALERTEDFEAMLRANPPIPERFRSLQASQSPFEGWDEQYSRTFLAPLDFLDRLSRIYSDPYQQELAKAGTGPEQTRLAREVHDFLVQRGSFSLAFRFLAQQGVQPDQRYCLIPQSWRRLPAVGPALSDLRMTDSAILEADDAGRAYLLRVQTGVAPACLMEPQE